MTRKEHLESIQTNKLYNFDIFLWKKKTTQESMNLIFEKRPQMCTIESSGF